MTQSAVLPSCPACGAIRTPGAPMCLQCWLPFEEPAQAAAAPVQPQVWPSAPVLPTQRNHRAARKRGMATRSSTIAGRVVGALVVLVVGATGVGGYLWYRHGQVSEPRRIADAFHSAHRLTLVPGVSVIPEIDAGSAGAAVAPAAFVSSVNPAVERIDTEINALQRLLDRWADGQAQDRAVHTALTTFTADLAPLNSLTEQAPTELYTAARQVQTAANGYALATAGLDSWLETGNGSGQSRYFTLVGDAAADWQSGITAMYRGAGLAVPALPSFTR